MIIFKFKKKKESHSYNPNNYPINTMSKIAVNQYNLTPQISVVIISAINTEELVRPQSTQSCTKVSPEVRI